MATDNIKVFAQKVAQSVKSVILAQQQAVTEGMLELEADLKDRVFLNGLDSNNSPIGKYSTKPMYASVSANSQARSSSLKPRGKGAVKGQRNQSQFKNGKERKSMYLPGGYSEYRKVVGRQNSTVDLNLTGSLLKDIRTNTADGMASLVFTTDKQAEIAAGNEKRFNKTIFSVSQTEADKLVGKWQDDVSNAFFDSFK